MKRILVVDDDRDLLEIVSDHFGDRYEVTTATSGSAGFDAFRCRRPDVVFLDASLPGGSGIETLRAMRDLDPGVPIVMVTMAIEIGVAERCLELGALAYVPRPFELEDMDHIAALATDASIRRQLTAS